MLALVPLLVPVATAAVTAVVLLILLIAVNAWFRSWAYDDEAPKRGLIGRITGWVGGKLKSAIRAAEKRLTAALSNAVAQKSPALVRLLDNLYQLTSRLGDEIANEAQQTYQALKVLRDVTLPAEIQQALKPVVQLATTALALARGTATTLTAMMAELRDTLRALPWGGALVTTAPWTAFLGSYRNLWDVTFKTLVPRVTELWNNRVPNLRARLTALENYVTTLREQALPAIRQRLGKIETTLEGILTDPTTWVLAALGLAAVPVLSAGGMRTALRNLTCRNTQTAAGELCRADSGFVDDLLTGIIGVLLLADLCDLIRLIREVAKPVAAAAEAIVGKVGGVCLIDGATEVAELDGYTA